MRSVMSFIAAIAATVLSTAAYAADMPIAAPPMYAAPPPPSDFGGWYLRGDIGMSNQSVGNVRDNNSAAYNNVNVNQTSSFGSAGIYGGGVGYQFNSWIRADVTGEYRGKANFTGLDVIRGTGPSTGFVGTDQYTATKSELLFLANAYVDLGTWWCITPFVGAGVGAARVSVADFTDTGDFINGGAQNHSFNYAGKGSQWNFAWAAHAGLAYKVSPGLTLELAYSYVDLGSGTTGATSSFDQVTNTTHAAFTYKNITSNDVKLGLRWNFDNPAPPPQPILYRKG